MFRFTSSGRSGQAATILAKSGSLWRCGTHVAHFERKTLSEDCSEVSHSRIIALSAKVPSDAFCGGFGVIVC